jgi:predicted nucleotidyltransferase
MAATVAAASSLSDARRAADALVAAGAAQVWLFGSVARGEQRDISDVDLVAVLDDLDYRKRREVHERMRRVAVAAAGGPVDVVVTDRAEWRIQRDRVTASFASAIAGDLMLLADAPLPGDVNWNKEQLMATSNEELAAQRLDDVAQQLGKMIGNLDPSRAETAAAARGDRNEGLFLRGCRLVDLCEAAHLAIEGSLKAVGTIAGIEARLLWGHDVGAIADALPPSEREAMTRLLAAAPDLIKTPGYISMWRSRGAYASPTDGMTAAEVASPGFSTAIARIACDVASAAAEGLAARGVTAPGAARTRRYTAEVRRHLANVDLADGRPLDQATTPDPPA